MKWVTLAFWAFIFVGLFFFFQSFAIFSFQQQEEMQLFIPEWSYIREMLAVPGGFCAVVGQALVQFYPNLWIALLVNTTLLWGIGILSFLILQKISRRGYDLLLSLIPVLALLKVSLNPDYILDGTVGIFFLLLFLYTFLCVRETRTRLIYSLSTLIAFFFLFGQLAAIYGVLLLAFVFLCRHEKWHYMFFAFLTGLILTYTGIRMAVYVPLTDGIYSKQYQEMQLQPDSFMFFVWIRFMALLLGLSVVVFLMKMIPWQKLWQKIFTTFGVTVALFLFSGFCVPDSDDLHNRMMDRLSYLERREKWDVLIRIHQGKKTGDYIDLNFLNMALAKEGWLGDKLFYFDQKGPFGLLAPWNRTYYMSVMLSDIHYMLGDIGPSESYAMEALTLARRKGSPRMLQRLVQTSLIRNDFKVAEKYIGLLARMPYYRTWAEKYRFFIRHPEQIREDKEFRGRQIPPVTENNLLCLIATDSLWKMHLTAPLVNRTAVEYLGCSYLLAKETDKFKTFLAEISNKPDWLPLPRHFQEAALMFPDNDVSSLDSLQVLPEIRQQYKQFQMDMVRAKMDPNGVGKLYRKYGNTYWFYFYCKQIK